MANPTVKELIKEALGIYGYDGLFSDDGECACEIDDLFPCGETYADFIAGYKVDCTPECQHDLPFHPGDWHIEKQKPVQKSAN